MNKDLPTNGVLLAMKKIMDIVALCFDRCFEQRNPREKTSAWMPKHAPRSRSFNQVQRTGIELF